MKIKNVWLVLWMIFFSCKVNAFFITQDRKKIAQDDLKAVSESLDNFMIPDLRNCVIEYLKYSKEATEKLFRSVYKKDLTNVKKSIEEGADVNAKHTFSPTTIDAINDTPLHLAVKYNYLEIIKILVENNADVNEMNSHGLTPLHYACQKGYLDIVKYLICNGAAVDAKETFLNGFTPLHFAIEHNHMELVKYLVEIAGSNIYALTARGENAITLCVWRSEMYDYFSKYIIANDLNRLKQF